MNCGSLGSPSDRFEAIARVQPEHPAVRLSDGTVTGYGELLALAATIRNRLAHHGPGPARPIAILHGKTPSAYATMIAALQLGTPYCCLDEANPAERQALVLERLSPCVLVAAGQSAEAVVQCQAAARLALGAELPLLNLDADSPDPAAIPEPEPADAALGSDVAYVMFTSGSTGRPKGAAIARSSLSNFIAWARNEFDIRPGDVVANVNPMHFDNAIFDVYAALFNGATLAPVQRADLDNAPRVVATLEAAGCTILFAVPSMLMYLGFMRALTAERLPRLRVLSFGGEPFPKPELAHLFGWFGGRARLVNVYGPTECTCICSAYDVTREVLDDPLPLAPLGRLARDFRGIILDGDRAVADGEAGELCLIGPNVGLGYYGDPERTQAAFVCNPQVSSLPERMYRTGDLVRRDPATGLLHFVGRKDHQIKHMGHRIELEEIEAVLAAIPGVRQVAVVYSRREPGRGPTAFGRIVAFVAVDTPGLDERGILETTRRRLPQYMVPHRVTLRDALPRNANGKIDRVQLAKEA